MQLKLGCGFLFVSLFVFIFFPKDIATSPLVGWLLEESLEGPEAFARELSVWSQYINHIKKKKQKQTTTAIKNIYLYKVT